MDFGDATDPIPPDIPSQDAVEMLQADARAKKRRAMLVMFVALPVLIAAIGGGWWYSSSAAASEQLQTAWDQASACLVGAPLEKGERASLRMRAIQLTAVNSERDVEADGRWPSRCADPVASVHEALRKQGGNEPGKGLLAASERFAPKLRKAGVMNDLSAEADTFFEAAAERKLVAQPFSLSVPTPQPAKAFNIDTLPAGAQISSLQHTLDSVSSTPMVGTEIHALVYDKKVEKTPVLCTFRRDGANRCRKLGGPLAGKSGLRLGGTVDEGASPLVLAGRKGDAGIFRSDGALEKITELTTQSAYVAKNGYVAITGYALDRKRGKFKLLQQAAPGAKLTTTTLRPKHAPGKAYQLHRWGLLWGKLIVQALYKDGDQTVAKLLYANLPITDKPKLHEIAKLNWTNAKVFGCRAANTMVVGVGVHSGFFTFFENDKWSSPVKIPGISGALSCHSGEAVLTSGYGGQDRCTPAGCKVHDGVAPKFEPFKIRDRFWTDLKGKVLAVASTDERGGMRYRWSTGVNLAVRGGDQVLFDDLIKDGKVQEESTLLGMLLAGRGTFAVVLATTPKGVYALRFDADGSPKPATIQH